MRNILLSLVTALLLTVPALADWTGKDASNTTITFFNTAACTSVVCKAQNQLIDSAGAEILGLVTASPAANTIGDRLKTINTTLGSPFQAGGSIGNTAFGANQGTAAAVTAPWPVYGGQAASVAMQNGATANGNGTTLTVTGYQTALVNVNCSVACSGGTTINFEGTDSTGTFFSVAGFPIAGTSTAVSNATTSGQFWVPVSGLTTIRARISSYSAGTITVTGTPVFGVNASMAQVVNTNANGQQTMANSSPVVIASNQSNVPTNQVQLNGNTVSTGNGTQGTGTQRVAIASDNSAVAGVGAGATGSAAPANASYNGTLQSGATGGQLKGQISCDNHVFKHITTATDTLAVQGVASQTVYVCGWRSRAAGTATWFLENTASANANCSSSNTQITGLASEIANSGDVTYNPIWGGLKNTSGNGLCINSTGTGGVDIDVWYTQF